MGIWSVVVDTVLIPDLKLASVGALLGDTSSDRSHDTYKTDEENYYRLKLKVEVGTEHSVLMNAVVYETPPNRDLFVQAIKRQL